MRLSQEICTAAKRGRPGHSFPQYFSRAEGDAVSFEPDRRVDVWSNWRPDPNRGRQCRISGPTEGEELGWESSLSKWLQMSYCKVSNKW